ncbi:MAG: alkaline phosphatase [Bacteroidales bacterium]|nr:alkaline phosphatase [Bacteroidales bacterium]
MKRLFILLCVLCAAVSANATELNNWKMQRQGDKRSYDVVVPCTVAGALNEAGVFGPDVLDADRYKNIDKSLFDSPWVFSTTFEAAKGLHHILRFESLGYSADIRVNGTLIASADTTVGPFCVREFDVTSLVGKKKQNKLQVTVYKAPAKSLNHGYVDWNPRPVDETMGILRKVELISTPDVQVQDVFVKPEVNVETLKEAAIDVTTTLVNRSGKPISGVLQGAYEGGGFREEVSLAAGESKEVKIHHQVRHPRIWWSRDVGRPELYNLQVSFIPGSSDKVSHSRKVRFGLRDIKGIVDKSGHRLFILNGREMLIKSAGWTDDIFMQDTPGSIRTQVEFVCDMNLNSIRFENIWGKDDTVYDLCDELGLLAMAGFSCQWEWENYCGYKEKKGVGCIHEPETEALAIRYFHDQIVRLRNHPSVICWLTGSDRVPNDRLEAEYMKIYDKLEYRPYVCSASGMSSKYGGPSGMKMEGPYEYVGPDYWYIDTKRGGAFGFNTETGIGTNIPQLESMRRMVGEDHLWPLDQMWDYHCTTSSSHMNNTAFIMNAVTGEYGAPTGIEDFMRKAHAIDYDGTRGMYEAFRCNVPKATGIVQWMLNSAWPSLYWQLYDWYLVPTAAYYGTKKACNPVQLVYNFKDRCVYTVDETVSGFEGTAVMDVYDAQGKLVRHEQKLAKFRRRSPRKVFEDIQGPCFISLKAFDEDGQPVADNFYCIPAEYNSYVWKKADWWGLPIEKFADLSFVSALPATSVKMHAAKTDKGFKVQLVNESETIAYQNILKAKTTDGELVPGVMWSDNFFTLCPGESRIVTCRVPKACGPVSVSLEGWNASAAIVSSPDSLRRDRSAFATYNFSRDDVYSKDETYDVVSVSQPKGKKVKNVIFMIGDGMGFEQVSCGWVVNGGKLNMEQMPYFGTSRTHAYDALVTDSCAGGTALAIGEKTRYHYIGLDKDGNPAESVLKTAQKKGKKTGVAVVCRINDATPEDFCGHSPTVRDEEGLAAQYIDSGVDFIAGGGLQFWTSRSDGRNLVEEMQAKGYTFVDKLEDVRGAKGDKFLGLFGPLDLPPCTERGPVLQECTMKAIEMLDNPKGFFLMVEGSQIDDYGHRNKIGPVVEELFDFDRTIGEVLKWAEKDGQTLVVVTADHACGGLTLLKGDLEKHLVQVNFSTKGHNGILVPVYAYGPHAEEFAGIHENAEIGQIVRKYIK